MINTNFIFNGAPDPESYKKSKKVTKQENISNQFIAFRKVATTETEGIVKEHVKNYKL